MKSLFLLAVLTLSACASKNIPLAMVKDDAPVLQLNPTRWTATVNDLMVPPRRRDAASPARPGYHDK